MDSVWREFGVVVTQFRRVTFVWISIAASAREGFVSCGYISVYTLYTYGDVRIKSFKSFCFTHVRESWLLISSTPDICAVSVCDDGIWSEGWIPVPICYQHDNDNFHIKPPVMVLALATSVGSHWTTNTHSPSTHQSQGKSEETQEVQELYVLQSKKVKLVATKSGPFSTLTDSFEVKWLSPLGIRGSRSFLQIRVEII